MTASLELGIFVAWDNYHPAIGPLLFVHSRDREFLGFHEPLVEISQERP